MLYDPKHASIYTVEHFARWLAAQPKRQRYDFADAEVCAAAQYLKAHGVAHHIVSYETLDALGWHSIVGSHPCTFGAAARRANRVVNGTLTSRLIGRLANWLGLR